MNALLIKLRLTTIPSSRKDKSLTDATILANSATSDAGHWSNNLWAPEALRQIRAAEAIMRALTYMKSAPFADSGDRIIPATKFMAFMEEFRAAEDARRIATEDFLQNYDNHIAHAKSRRNGLFRIEDYPSLQDAKARFTCKLDTKPLPAIHHFSEELASIESVRESLQAQIDNGVRAAKQDISSRIIVPLEKFLEKAADDPTSITAGTIRTITEIASIITDLDFDGTYAPTIAALNALELEPEAIRTDEWERAKATRAVKNILTKMMP